MLCKSASMQQFGMIGNACLHFHCQAYTFSCGVPSPAANPCKALASTTAAAARLAGWMLSTESNRLRKYGLVKGPWCSASTTPGSEGLTRRKEEREEGGMPGLLAAAGCTSTYTDMTQWTIHARAIMGCLRTNTQTCPGHFWP